MSEAESAHMAKKISVYEGVVIGENKTLTLAELSRACNANADWIISLVEEGIIEPRGRGIKQWRFSSICLRRARSVRRFQEDLGVNLPGAALVLELLEELEELRAKLRQLE